MTVFPPKGRASFLKVESDLQLLQTPAEKKPLSPILLQFFSQTIISEVLEISCHESIHFNLFIS